MRDKISWLALAVVVVAACGKEIDTPDVEPDVSNQTMQDSGVDGADAGSSDLGEQPPDTSGHDTASGECRDVDEDTICDVDELDRDTDDDGIPNAEDDDSDGDGVPDSVEAGDSDPATPPRDSDEDGIPDFLDPDSDADGISDAEEGVDDPDGDGEPNYLDKDSDGDGIGDTHEAGDLDIRTPPHDSDADGVPDYLELDSDGDRLPDAAEDADLDGALSVGETDRTLADTDDDGADDLVEVGVGTDPTDRAIVPATVNSTGVVIPFEEGAPEPALISMAIEIQPNVPTDISAEFSDGVGDAVDTTALVSVLRTAQLGTGRCPDDHIDQDRDGDGVSETYVGIESGERICWELEITENTLVDFDGTVQTFVGFLEISADSSPALEWRVYFIVPPV